MKLSTSPALAPGSATPVATPPPGSPGTGRKKDMGKRAALSAFFGSLVEYYDFMLFASASALIFGPVFFAPLGSLGAMLASLGTFGVAYLARPVGAVLFGTFGDKVGRKRALMWSLNLMGVATVVIGLLPGYGTIGIAAPILLVLMRLLQGLSAGGEQAGSNSLTVEHAPEGKRGLYASWTMMGTTAGNMLGAVAFLLVALMPHDVLLSWGWRIPFLVAAPMMLVAALIRRSVEETESFKENQRTNQSPTVPLKEVFVRHWRSVLRVIGCCLLAVMGTIISVYGLSYATGDHVGMNPSTYLLAITLGNVAMMVALPLWARFSDRVGRRPVFAASMILAGLLIFPFLLAVSTGNFWLVLIAAVIVSVVGGAANGIQSSLYTEMFPSRVRYTGVAIGTQIGYMIGGFAPAIAKTLEGEGSTGWVPVAVFACAALVVSGVCSLLGKETSKLDLKQLDVR
jgi:MFS family permease